MYNYIHIIRARHFRDLDDDRLTARSRLEEGLFRQLASTPTSQLSLALVS